MAAIGFVPATPVTHTDNNSGRQLDFTQSRNGTLSVQVHYGLEVINGVIEDHIFIEPKFIGLRRPDRYNVKDMTPEQKKALIESVRNDTLEVIPENGEITEIKKRNTVNDVFFYKIRSIILAEK